MQGFFKSLKSIQTTAMGIALILIAVGTAMKSIVDGDPGTTVSWDTFVAEIVIAWGLLRAKDGDKSTEDVS